MKIHYFQRYHQKENVATANTMLLLKRLYQYSSNKFFQFLKTAEFFDESYNPEIDFALQERKKKSVPDATITQESFKIVVETKTSDWFYTDQLMRHLGSFSNENKKIIMTLSPERMSDPKIDEFEKELEAYNNSNKQQKITYKNTTFEELANAIRDVLDDRDYEMQEVLNDYMDYLYHDNLLPNYDAWKYMRVQLTGQSFSFNVENGTYFDSNERGFRPHEYLGLYQNKSVRAIGKIVARIMAETLPNGEVVFEPEFGELTEERKEKIKKAIEFGEMKGWGLKSMKHRYFIVEKFYETDFKKSTPRAPMGSRIFDLTDVLNQKDKKLPETEEIARLLRNKEWS